MLVPISLPYMYTASEMENEEGKPFLAPESHSSEPGISHGRPMKAGLVRTSTLMHLVLISLYTIVSITAIKMNGCPSLVLLQSKCSLLVSGDEYSRLRTKMPARCEMSQ